MITFLSVTVCSGYTNCDETYGVYYQFVRGGNHRAGAFRGCQVRGAQLASFQTVEKFDKYLDLRRHHDNPDFGENI